jgi:hypothetical protein
MLPRSPSKKSKEKSMRHDHLTLTLGFLCFAAVTPIYCAVDPVKATPVKDVGILALAPCTQIPSNLADLAASVKLTPTRFIGYTVANCSRVGTVNGFQVDIYLNGVLKESIQHAPLAARERQTVIAGEAGLTDCKTAEVKVVLDSKNAVAEADENNNLFNRQMTPPCPDVTAHIDQDVVNYGLHYYAKITVINQGAAVMPVVNVQTIGIPDTHSPGSHPPSPDQCVADPTLQIKGDCFVNRTSVGPLGPGESKKYHAGDKQLRSTTLFVKVGIMCGQSTPEQCAQSNTNNDVVTRVLGPH